MLAAGRPSDSREVMVPTYAEWVATAALVLSATGLVWQVRRSADLGVRLEVTGDVQVLVPAAAGPVRRELSLVVSNTGRRGTTLADVGWEDEAHPGTTLSLAFLLGDPDLARRWHDEVTGPGLPLRLAGSDRVEWTLGEPLWRAFEGRVRPVVTSVAGPARRVGAWRSARQPAAVGEWIDLPES